MRFRLCETAMTLLVMASLASFAEAADRSSYPPDSRPHSRPVTQEDLNLLKSEKTRQTAVPTAPLAPTVLLQSDVVVNNVDPNLRNTDTLGGSEPGIAVDP